ncbi:MAG: S8 family serine peptidase [Micromonosporaceae bacterium]
MRIRHILAGAAAATAAVASAIVLPMTATAGESTEYTVLAEPGVSGADAVAAIEAAGGEIVSRNDAVGMYRVVSSDKTFAADARKAGELVGAARRTPIGYAPKVRPTAPDPVEAEHLTAAGRKARGASAAKAGATAGMDPLDDKLWGLGMVKSDQARGTNPGSKQVKVGILDTGLDASNPDLAANFDAGASRNFAKDMTDIDGPCEVASCLDPVGTDDGGHGTHVAGTVGAAANGFGLSGVAPNVSLVELKGGQDSGYFFLEPTVNALTYAGDAGLDVVNMSFYVDPWLYNCLNAPEDSDEARIEQMVIIAGMTRALDYAHHKGVTLVGALGNNHEDLGDPRTDTSSPDYPADTAYPRTIDNDSCWDLPVEGPHVIGVSSLGPSGKKSDFSNYGTEQISVAAPGGWFRDGYGTPTFRTPGNMILSAYPKKVLQEEGLVDADGNITPGGAGAVFKDCTTSGECGYYTFLQGTSMAAPHASGVASLIVSAHGSASGSGFGLAPSKVEKHLYKTADTHACPTPRLQTYTNEGRSPEFNAYCEGGEKFNGFYGYGIVDAYAAVTTPLR